MVRLFMGLLLWFAIIPFAAAQPAEHRIAPSVQKILDEAMSALSEKTADAIAKGLTLIERAEAKARALHDPFSEAEAKIPKAALITLMGNPKKGLDEYQAASDLLIKAKAREGAVAMWIEAIDVFRDAGSPEYSLTCARNAVSASQGLGDSEYVMGANLMAGIMTLEESSLEAAPYLQVAFDLSVKLKVHETMVESGYRLAAALSRLGQYQKSADIAQQLLFDKSHELDAKTVAFLSSIIGNDMLELGLYDGALLAYEGARASAIKAQDPGTESVALANIANLYARIGMVNESAFAYSQAIEVVKGVSDPKTKHAMSQALAIDKATLFSKLERLPEARKAFEGVEADGISDLSLDLQGATYHGHGEVLRKMGDFKSAKEKFLSAREIGKRGGFKSLEAISLNSYGMCLAQEGDLAGALGALKECMALRTEVGEPLGIATTLGNVALCYFELGKKSEAYEGAQLALKWVTGTGELNANGSSLSSGFVASQSWTLALAAFLAADSNDLLGSLRYAEQGRSRAMMERCGAQDRLLATLTSEDVETLRKLEGQLARAETDLQAARSAGSDFSKIETLRDAAAVQLDTFWDQMRAMHPENGQHKIAPEQLRAQLEHSLEEDEAVVVVLDLSNVFLHKVSLLVIRKRDGHLVTKNVALDDPGKGSWSALIANFLSACSSRSQGILSRGFPTAESSSRSDAETKGAGGTLSRLFWAPLAPELKGVKKIAFCPEDEFWDLALGAVPTAEGSVVADEFEVDYEFSIEAWLAAKQQVAKAFTDQSAVLVVANPDYGDTSRFKDTLAFRSIIGNEWLAPLPGTAKEAEQIGSLSKSCHKLMGPEADEQSVKAALPTADVLHLATHGRSDGDAPMSSMLVLSTPPAGSGEDGFLSAREISTMTLTARLAVLSACDSGKSGQVGGESAVGFSWALYSAGCRNQVVSLWPVDDEATAELMAEFYDGLLVRSESPSKALSSAQKKLRADPRYKSPYFWAPFIVIGD